MGVTYGQSTGRQCCVITDIDDGNFAELLEEEYEISYHLYSYKLRMGVCAGREE